jgi:hypothetical protein
LAAAIWLVRVVRINCPSSDAIGGFRSVSSEVTNKPKESKKDF